MPMAVLCAPLAASVNWAKAKLAAVSILMASGPLILGDGQFNQPWGVAADANGNIFVADTWNGRIQVFDKAGKFLRKWGVFNTTNGELGDANVLFGPRGIAITPDGGVLVADTGNKRIIKYTADGQLVNQIGGGGPTRRSL